MKAPLLLLASAFLWSPLAPAPALGEEGRPAATAVLPPPPGPGKAAPPVDKRTAEALARAGWKAENGDLLRLAGAQSGYIPAAYLELAKIEWKYGKLVYGTSLEPLPREQLAPILDGLWLFVSAAKTPPEDAAKNLTSWGLPPTIDGRKLLNPDGAATYYGQMLHLLYAPKPDAVARGSVERLSQALDLLDHAYAQAFSSQAPDIAKTDIDRAKLMLLAPPRPGEKALDIKAREDFAAQLADFKEMLVKEEADAAKAGDETRRKDSAAALATLNNLESQRYHRRLELPPVPKPGEAAPPAVPGAISYAAYAPLAGGLPRLLRVLDRVNGKPLNAGQQENLIRSFPMGELVWRLGVQDLWRQGLTGAGVKVAVIDGGIARHSELDGAVKSRVNFTADRGRALSDDHATHVAGIIHALSPDAQINGYTVFPDGGNAALQEDVGPLIVAAIDRAVADGNRVINLSLGGGGSPSRLTARAIEKYAEAGVIFVVAAGNERDQNGIEAPSVAPNALTAGSLNAAGRAADSSSYGSNFDARKLQHVVKAVFLAPGENINSTVPGGYRLMSGTSMATPVVSGVAALLAQAASFPPADSVAISARVRDALAEGSSPIALDQLPPNVPFDQTFLIVQPLAALDALRRRQAPATAGEPARK